MRHKHSVVPLLFFFFLISFASAGDTSSSRAASGDTAKAPAGDYVGSDTCKTCHEDQYRRFSHTRMGKIFFDSPRTAAQRLGCESCHGPGKAHVEAGGGKDTIPLRFAKDSRETSEEQNSACLQCHQRGNRMFWKGSPHESRGLACVDCHQIMGGRKPDILTGDSRFSAPLSDVTALKKTPPELCLQCHQIRRAQLLRSAHMPFREGKVTCTSCHNPHGSPNPKQLIQATVNENCYSCHAERRGPFLWEHPPVMENCLNCHEAHGSTNPQLLKARTPRLCQQCHITARHPTQPQNLNIKVFNRGCTNCHSVIHGSNNPSGMAFNR